MDKLELLKEANRRGILPPDKKPLYDEAVRRGLIKEDRTFGQKLKRQMGLAARYGAEGLANVGSIVTDPIAALANMGGANIPSMREAVPQMLDQAGLPQPENPLERVVGQASRGVAAGVMPGGPALQMAGATSGMGAGAGGQTAAEMGAGPGGQMAAALAGGIAPGAAAGAARGAIGLAGKPLAPFFQSGRERAIGGLLNKQATSPVGAQAKAAFPDEFLDTQGDPFLKALQSGSKPTLGQASRDPGLLALERGVRNKDPAEFAVRAAQQNAARRTVMDSIAKSEGQIAKMKEWRERITAPVRERAFQSAGKLNFKGLSDDLDTMIADPENQGESVQRLLANAKKQLAYRQDAKAAYAIRKEIANRLESKPVTGEEKALQRNLRRISVKLLQTVDGYIEEAAPGYKQYLNRYARASRAINRGELGAELLSKAETTSTSPVTGDYIVSPAAWIRGWRKNAAEIKKVLTPRQQRRLSALTKEMERGALIHSPDIKAAGSDTFQNITTANLLGRVIGDRLGKSAVAQTAARPLAWAYKIPEEQMQELLVEAMLDPKLAAALMAKATPKNIKTASELLLERSAALAVASQAPETQ